MVCATEPRVGGGRANKRVFLKYLNLNSKLDILDNFPNDGTIFPRTSKKINQKVQGKKKLAGGGAYVPPPRHLVVTTQKISTSFRHSLPCSLNNSSGSVERYAFGQWAKFSQNEVFIEFFNTLLQRKVRPKNCIKKNVQLCFAHLNTPSSSIAKSPLEHEL